MKGKVGTTYGEFLATKAQVDGASGFEPDHLPDHLFGFQRALVEWAVRMGRAALFVDTGLGKSPMSLAWAENVRRRTGRPVLVMTALGVAFQLEREAAKFGYDAAVSRDGTLPAPITITNYEQAEKFDAARFGGVVADESSILKNFEGVRRGIVTEFLRTLPYRLLDTATAAPNDYVELGTSSEALGYLGYTDMLSRFFTTRERSGFYRRGQVGNGNGAHLAADRGQWRFKGHAEEPFWRWVASWARAIRKPSDLGYPDDGFALPPLRYRRRVIQARTVRDGLLFDLPAQGLQEEREELRRTVAERCEQAASALDDAECGIAWCHLNAEGDLLANLIDGAVQVAGSEQVEAKEEKLAAFARGEIRVLVTKPSIAAWGLNWQHCHRMTYFPTNSYEAFYQAVRRCWRFGQAEPVTVDVVSTEGGAATLANLERKAAQADRMFDALTAHMRDALSMRRTAIYDRDVEVPAWAKS